MIRRALITDARAIHQLLLGYAQQGQLLGRSLVDIYDALRDFHVFEEEGQIIGVGALQICWENLAEIRSLAVKDGLIGRGIGRLLVEACLEEARLLGLKRVFALTYQPRFFEKLGFTEIEKSDLPHKIWTDCIHCIKFPDCDEIALAIDL
ncbi:N-acetyltransferase [Geopsychrobacter electrodiphilus]|uniref:N-acetyltransferase n=1 Tax=Geopsychrobacter electrodiphilus TaxID=225196 RepID=UPI00037BB18A|nr:N-acetyltransferase [Geopsychrobacter electrodiphilus]